MNRASIFGLAWLLGGGSLIQAQSPGSVFRASTTLQSIAVQVTDKQGNYTRGLSVSDFSLLEDGQPQKIAFFEAGNEPISLAILIDTGRSMDFGGKLDRARAFLAPLVRGNRPEDEIFLMPFADEVGRFQVLSAEQRLHPPAIALPGHRGSALYDALAATLCHMRNAKNARQAVVVITDGVDQSSRLKLEQLTDLVGSSSPQVFMVGLYNQQEKQIFAQNRKTMTIVGLRKIDNPPIVFKRLAKESGAESFFPSSEQDLKKALNRISELLKAQYTLAYYPRRADRVRKIEVRVRRSGVKVSARQTAGAENGSRTPLFKATSCEVSAKDHPYPWESRVTSVESAPMVYHEDFSDTRSGWPNRHEPEMDAHYNRGKGYVVSRWLCPNGIASSQDGEVIAVNDKVIAAYGPWWNDFRAEATLEPQWQGPGCSRAAVGMVFHLMEQGYYSVLLSPEKANELSLELVRGYWSGVLSPILSGDFVSNEHSGRRHKLSVTYDHGQITIEIDGANLGSVRDKTFEYGLVGFGVFGKGDVEVHDLRVEALGSTRDRPNHARTSSIEETEGLQSWNRQRAIADSRHQ